jgi:hypothetical protein
MSHKELVKMDGNYSKNVLFGIVLQESRYQSKRKVKKGTLELRKINWNIKVM